MNFNKSCDEFMMTSLKFLHTPFPNLHTYQLSTQSVVGFVHNWCVKFSPLRHCHVTHDDVIMTCMFGTHLRHRDLVWLRSKVSKWTKWGVHKTVYKVYGRWRQEEEEKTRHLCLFEKQIIGLFRNYIIFGIMMQTFNKSLQPRLPDLNTYQL